MNTLSQLPPGPYFHVSLSNDPALREHEIAAAVTKFAQANGAPAEAFIFRVSNRPFVTDHLCLGPTERTPSHD
jgi:hypothetical protein